MGLSDGLNVELNVGLNVGLAWAAMVVVLMDVLVSCLGAGVCIRDWHVRRIDGVCGVSSVGANC